ncbi:MarR family transcriptional regulator [Streptomyces sp. AK02-01A]|uniref:MarR family winged helix-turn-helix transcriptional regulator n=1 Tax=Streptomyces sp. AK02-01A TaxID=3028648 RepID=UPI0029AD3AA4|nr:MarR family transcriptional regulator [Streptomyces sp. AK02-01A]MDX3850473.1 MarR family transcriptional regulator [Streptomyces sp. AK02-01A]
MTASEAGATEPTQLAGRLRTAIQHLVPVLRDQSAQRDLTPSRRAAMATLAAHGPLRVSDLAARMGITVSTASRMVDLLDGSGWIERGPDPLDQRASLIRLNETGRALLDSLRREATRLLAERINRLTEAQRHSLGAALPALEALSELETLSVPEGPPVPEAVPERATGLSGEPGPP